MVKLVDTGILQMQTIPFLLQECQDKMAALRAIILPEQLSFRLVELDRLINEPTFWGNPRLAAETMKERQKIADVVGKLQAFQETLDFNSDIVISFPEETESLRLSIEDLYHQMSELEFQQIMKDPIDKTPAILTISAGAGGLESANWVTILLRMYVRYATQHQFQVEILDQKPSEEHRTICTDTVSIRLEGEYAFGYFKSEAGVHRLIRNSPFNATGQRHTSFAAIQVTPDIEDTIDIKINDNDLEITAQTAGGPGGQNVNKVASAIRLKHLPSGISLFVRTERDQLSNKKTALKMLKAKLYEIEMNKQKEKIDKQMSQLSDVSFGHQIRTYTLSPYQLVKDHRTDCESNNADAVLDGDLQPFIVAFLRHSSPAVV
jgi:peptide chain release factor 2